MHANKEQRIRAARHLHPEKQPVANATKTVTIQQLEQVTSAVICYMHD